LYKLFMRNLCFFIFLCLVNVPAQASGALSGPYRAQVLEIIDGDTFRARIQVWLGQEVETLVRLDGVDAPELHGACSREKELARQAKARLENLIGAKTVSLRDVRYGKYAGRVLAQVGEGKTEDISALLSAENLAVAYHGGKRGSWCRV